MTNCIRCNTYPMAIGLKVCNYCNKINIGNRKPKLEKEIPRSIKRFFYPDTIGIGFNKE